MKPILVSACLLGVGCRYDGAHKRNDAVCNLLTDAILIPICPEILGGLSTPRPAAERVGERVLTAAGTDVTEAYQRGAREALALAQLYGCEMAILKEKSPACGCGQIYDGTFTRTLTPGDGVAAQLLKQHDIRVVGESALWGFTPDPTSL